MPENYKVELKRSAEKELKGMPPADLKRIAKKIGDLAQDPRPSDCVKLAGSPYFRLRQGDWRVVYSVDDEARVVMVAKIGHRREVYR